MRTFDYYKPQTIEGAIELLGMRDKMVFPLAGATDLLPNIREDLCALDAVVDIKGLPGLRDIKSECLEPCCGCGPRGCLYVGAAARMNEIVRSDLVKSHWDILAQGAASMGNEQVRNRATIGGNLCTSSPAADTAPALLTLEADVLIAGPRGERCVPVGNFFIGPKRNVLSPGEFVVALVIPQPPDGAVGVYEKLSRRKAGDLSIVGVAALAMPHNGAYRWRIALGAVAPTPVRAPDAEKILNASFDADAIETAARSASDVCSPIEDVRSGAEYRRAMIVNITRRAIQNVVEKLA
ncbi:MAG: FAD binding domain-containing protein [Anaerolineales bacterium]